MIEKTTLFWISALAGTGLLLIQALLSLLGADHHDDISGAEGGLDEGHFKWLSKQAIAGFLMMFGWVGLSCIKEFALSDMTTTLIALTAGVISFLITGLLFRLARRLRSSGSVFCIDEAIGKEAVIYQQIPKGGAGKVTVSLQNLTHEIDAISFTDERLASFTKVQIIKKENDHTVVVVPLK
jgi:hypothetical protein